MPQARKLLPLATAALACLITVPALGTGTADAATSTTSTAQSTLPADTTRPTPTTGLHTDSCTVDPAVPKRQLRAAWIATVVNIDWPSRPGLTPEQQKTELVAYLDEAVDRKLNAVILQVRPTADAFWPSPYEPWSKYLTGTQGQHPGYDPLAFAVEEAHARNLELHAWFNPYRVSMDTDRDALVPEHPARQHPEWVHAYGGKLYYDPGIPMVRELTVDTIMHAVTNYDIDGVHFDDYFYPYPVGTEEFPDDATFAEYGGDFTDKGDWRRDNVNDLITDLDEQIHEAKPWVKFGVSPFAVWRNQATDPEGSATTAGAETYDDLYADTRRWVLEEWVDYIAPQVYWSIGFAPADYAVLVPWWSEQVSGTNVQLYIGQATYKVGVSTQSPEWMDPAEMTRHLYFNRDHPEVDGDIYFSAIQMRANRLGHMDIVEADHYSRPALQHVTADVPGLASRRPLAAFAHRTDDGVRVRWLGTSSSYAVYRFDGIQRRPPACEFADATHLVGTVPDDGLLQSWVDTTAEPGQRYTYFVTALDRAYRESGRSNPAPVLGR
jgi:uncharacterized lipoprotein YddW (UPF0748 family)